MNVLFSMAMSLFPARQASVAAVFVYTLVATGAAVHGQGFDAPDNEHRFLDNVVLAQHADDCGCADDEGFNDDDENFSDFDEQFDQEMDAEFAEDFDDDVDQEHADDYGDEDDEDYVEDHDDTPGSVLSAQQRLDRNLDRQIQVIEKTILWRNPMGPGYF